MDPLKIIKEIKDNIGLCCSITMEPDEVLELLDKLEKWVKNQQD
jgi:hypothetical protein